MLDVQGLTVRYGRVRALTDVSLQVGRGSAVAVLGRNGAGKSTLLRAIAGLVRPAGGTITWEGDSLRRVPADRRARMGIATIPEGRRIFPGLTVRENLLLGGFDRRPDEREAALREAFDLFPILADRADGPAGALSGGQQQILAVARALMTDPAVMLLDEPSLGLAPGIIDTVYDRLTALRDRGIGIVLVEQHVHRALEFVDHAVVLNVGRVVLEEHPAVLREDPRLIAAYMGDGRVDRPPAR